MKNILIYGTSNKAMRELPALLLHYHVLGFVDSNAQKHPKILLGLPIYHYAELPDLEYDLIIICSSFFGEISQNLLSLGIKKFVNSAELEAVQEFTNEWFSYLKATLHIQRKELIQSIPNVALKHEHIAGCEMITDRIELLKRLPQNGVVAEFGVANGDYSSVILAVNKPQRLHLVDVWNSERYNDGLLNNIKTKFAAQIKEGQVLIQRQFSQIAINEFPDQYFDWVYIDTTHSYQQTRLELELVDNKLKRGGIIAGHDYVMGNWVDDYKYGVIEAVHEFCVSHNYRFKYLTMDLTENQSFAIEKIV